MNQQKRKQLTAAYLEKPVAMGVYQIKNNVTGKLLLGSSNNLHGAVNRHRFLLNLTQHENPELQEDWRKYGEEIFSFDILDQLKPKEDAPTGIIGRKQLQAELEILEEMWLEKLQPYDDQGYNLKKPGQ